MRVEDSFFSAYLRLLRLSMYVKAAKTTRSSVKISNVFIEPPFRSRKGQPRNYPHTVYTDYKHSTIFCKIRQSLLFYAKDILYPTVQVNTNLFQYIKADPGSPVVVQVPKRGCEDSAILCILFCDIPLSSKTWFSIIFIYNHSISAYRIEFVQEPWKYTCIEIVLYAIFIPPTCNLTPNFHDKSI